MISTLPESWFPMSGIFALSRFYELPPKIVIVSCGYIMHTASLNDRHATGM